MIINLFNFSKKEIFFSLAETGDQNKGNNNKRKPKGLKETATGIINKAGANLKKIPVAINKLGTKATKKIKNSKNLLTKENVTKGLIGGTLAAGGLTSVGFGIGKIMEEYQKTSNNIFSDKANQYHTVYNKYQDILSANGSLSMLKDPNFVALAGNKELLNALSSGKPAGLKDLLANSNFNNLLQNPTFTNILSSGNSASLDLLLKNQEIFKAGNLANIKNIMDSSGLQDLLRNSEFKKLLGDQKFLEMIKSPNGLSEFYSSENIHGLIGENYTKFLNDPKIKEILSNANMQGLLQQEGMTDLLKNPNFFALFSDEKLKPLLANGGLHELLGNAEFTKLLGNSDALTLLRDPKILEMISVQSFPGMLENPAFAQMIKDPANLMALMKDPQLDGYMEAASKVGISTAGIAGIIALILSVITLVSVGVLVFSKMKGKEKNANQLDKKSDQKVVEEIELEFVEKVSKLSDQKEITGKELGELSKAFTDLKSSLSQSQDNNLIKNIFEARKTNDPIEISIENLIQTLQKELGKKIEDQDAKFNTNEISAMNNIIEATVKDASEKQNITLTTENFKEKIDEIAKNVISQIGKLEVGSKINLESIEKGIQEGKSKGSSTS